MAKFRAVQAEFWTDGKIMEEFSPEDRYFFLYLLTNPATTQIGIYDFSPKKVAFELGYDINSVKSIIERFENIHKMIKYNRETREIAILNWGKYNFNKGGKPIFDCIKNELPKVKDKNLIRLVLRRIEKKDIRNIYKEFLNDTSYDTHHDTGDDTSSKKSVHENINSKEMLKEHDPLNTNTFDDTSTIRDATRGQKEQQQKKEQQEEKEEEEKQQQENKSDTVNCCSSFSQDELDALLHYEKAGFGMLSERIKELIISDIELYGLEWFKEAIDIAVREGKYKLSYVEGILRNWKTDGKQAKKLNGKVNTPMGTMSSSVADALELARKYEEIDEGDVI